MKKIICFIAFVMAMLVNVHSYAQSHTVHYSGTGGNYKTTITTKGNDTYVHTTKESAPRHSFGFYVNDTMGNRDYTIIPDHSLGGLLDKHTPIVGDIYYVFEEFYENHKKKIALVAELTVTKKANKIVSEYYKAAGEMNIKYLNGNTYREKYNDSPVFHYLVPSDLVDAFIDENINHLGYNRFRKKYGSDISSRLLFEVEHPFIIDMERLRAPRKSLRVCRMVTSSGDKYDMDFIEIHSDTLTLYDQDNIYIATTSADNVSNILNQKISSGMLIVKIKELDRSMVTYILLGVKEVEFQKIENEIRLIPIWEN